MSRALKSEEFRNRREGDWRELDRLLRKIERKSARALSDDELIALPVLYRSAMSALASARSTSLDQALVRYLESLCARAYYFVYGVRSGPVERISAFFARTVPAEMKGVWKETLVSIFIMGLSAVVAYLLVMGDPDWYFSFVPEQLVQGRTPASSAEELREALYDNGGDDAGLGAFASFLFTNNAQVALTAFALGFCLALPTIFLLGQTGLMLGAFVALYVQKGLGVEIGGWLLIHGVTEIFAIILAGAAGIRIGWAIGFPGALGRLEALVAAGRRGAGVMGGVVLMLAAAGVLEGFGRQLITNDATRYAIAAATGLFWAVYFYLPRKARGHAEKSA